MVSCYYIVKGVCAHVWSPDADVRFFLFVCVRACMRVRTQPDTNVTHRDTRLFLGMGGGREARV